MPTEELRKAFLPTIVTNPCEQMRGGAVRDEDVRVVPSLFVERIAMVEEDRDAGSHRVGRLAFGVIHDYTPEPVATAVMRLERLSAASGRHAERYYEHVATQGMRDNDTDAHPAGTGVHPKRIWRGFLKQRGRECQRLTY